MLGGYPQALGYMYICKKMLNADIICKHGVFKHMTFIADDGKKYQTLTLRNSQLGWAQMLDRHDGIFIVLRWVSD